MKAREEKYNDTEVRLRMVENAIIRFDTRFDTIDAKFEKLESKIDSNFKWTLGVVMASNFLPFMLALLLHSMKII
jgi:hypothetical protein